MIDWNSFWINIYAGSVYFVLGILVSIWLIPKYTLKLVRKRNKKYLKQKISFAISEICNFFNKMPSEFKVNENTSAIYCTNLKYSEYNDFVAILNPNLLQPAAIEETYVRILNTARNSESIDRYELMKDEMERLQKLRISLENITGTHSSGLEDLIINEISQLCLEIRVLENMSDFNRVHEELTGEKEGIHGLSNLKKVYENAYELLLKLITQKGFFYKSNPTLA
ncbi:MAG: hypothetical protein ABJH04_08515 [Cyclobacteriaceae bacterium]